ncbi:MAG TPA: response regulator [Pyrinomonadaceae bacterium]|nr:response regulator [Pyrinomonadaceae bacterium]
MSTASRQTVFRAPKGRVLLVEDTFDLRSLLRLALEGEGYEVLEAEDGVAAVEVALRERPDAIIMDMSLPRLGGDQAAKLIRREPSLSRVPVIACTALNRWEWRGKSIVAGCDAFVTKPIDFDQLRQVLAQLLARRAS